MGSYRERERRLAALEARQRAVTVEDGEAARVARLREWEAACTALNTRLAPHGLAFYSHSPRTTCACCAWPRLRVHPLCKGRLPDERDLVVSHRCVVCGAQEFGLVGERIASYFVVAHYTCPRCDHAYTGPRATLTPCPACSYAPPLFTEDDEEVWHEVMVATMGRPYGIAVVAAWLDMGEAETADALAALNPWWFETVQADLAQQDT